MRYTYSYSDDTSIRAWSGGAWADFDHSGNLIRQNPQNPKWVMEKMTDEELQEASEVIRSLADAPISGNVYLRFNSLPDGGKSKNYATGKKERGISCYALRWDLINQCYKRTGGGFDCAVIAYAIQGAPMYLISGTECGTGSDGEPVLDEVKVLAELKFARDKDGYVLA